MHLGIDIGGTKVALALAERGGEIVARARQPFPATGDPRRDMDILIAAAQALAAEAGCATSQIERVGIGAPGPLDVATGEVIHPPNLKGWARVPIREWAEQAFEAPCNLENDANGAALAEWKSGAGQGARDLAYLTMSTGVGGGLILDGALYRGPFGTAAELGHVPVEWPGERCGCGLSGCLEAYCGGLSWQRHLRATAPIDGGVARLAGGRDEITPVHLVEAARTGDAWALAEMSRWNGYLVRGLVALVFALAPEIIVLGTIATAAGDALCFEPVRRAVEKRIWRELAPGLRIVPSSLGDDLPLRAALAIAEEGALRAEAN